MVVLVFDELQTVAASSGTRYVDEQLGMMPDGMGTAKGLGGGFPIGAMLTTAEIAKALAFGTHGSTYGGNPLACAVAGAVLEEIVKPELKANVLARSQQLKAGLTQLSERHGMFGVTRGNGLLVGLTVAERKKA